jgi:hypothetical protein
MELKEIGCNNVDWFQWAEDSDQWWAVVNVEMNMWSLLE